MDECFCGNRIPTSDIENIVVRARQDLERLRGAHLFLTGGTAFFGKWLLESLCYADKKMDLGLQLTVQSRDPELFLQGMPHLRVQKCLSFWKGELTALQSNSIQKVTHIIHAANIPNSECSDFPLRHTRFAVDGSRSVQEMAEQNPVKKVLLVSSGGAYRAEPIPLAEACGANDGKLHEQQNALHDNIKVPTVYGVTKRFLEVLWSAWGAVAKVDVPIARCFAFIGPHMPLNNAQAVGNFMADALAGRDITINGDGNALRTYMYGADLVVWLLALLTRGRHCIPYNVGSEEVVSIRRLAEKIQQSINPNCKVNVLGAQTEGNAPDRYIPDTRRAREELGLVCEYSLEDSIKLCSKNMRVL